MIKERYFRIIKKKRRVWKDLQGTASHPTFWARRKNKKRTIVTRPRRKLTRWLNVIDVFPVRITTLLSRAVKFRNHTGTGKNQALPKRCWKSLRKSDIKRRLPFKGKPSWLDCRTEILLVWQKLAQVKRWRSSSRSSHVLSLFQQNWSARHGCSWSVCDYFRSYSWIGQIESDWK